MGNKLWKLQIDGHDYTVTFDHGYWSGRRLVKVNDAIVVNYSKLFDTGSQDIFNINDHICVAIVRVGRVSIKVKLELFVDDRAMDEKIVNIVGSNKVT